MGLPSHKTGQSIEAAREGLAKSAIPPTPLFCLVVIDCAGTTMSIRNSKKLYCGSATLAILASGLCLMAAPATAQQVAANADGDRRAKSKPWW